MLLCRLMLRAHSQQHGLDDEAVVLNRGHQRGRFEVSQNPAQPACILKSTEVTSETPSRQGNVASALRWMQASRTVLRRTSSLHMSTCDDLHTHIQANRIYVRLEDQAFEASSTLIALWASRRLALRTSLPWHCTHRYSGLLIQV